MDQFSHIYKKLFTMGMPHQVCKHFDREHEQFFFCSPLGYTVPQYGTVQVPDRVISIWYTTKNVYPLVTALLF